MKILFGTPVATRDGKDVGRVKELIIDPRTRTVTHIVVQQGLLFGNDRIVSADDVDTASETAVVLRLSEAELTEGSVDYEQDHFIRADVEEIDALEGELSASYWTRPLDVPASLIPPGLGRVELSPEIAIPGDDVLLVHDSPVGTRDGEHIGRVREVMTNEEDCITHIVVAEGVVYPVPKLVPVDWVSGIADNQVTLSVSKAAVDQLSVYGE